MREKVAGERQWKLQHRLVWERAHGPIPKRACIHHRNHDKTDNRLENLEMMESNAKHARLHGTLKTFNRRPYTAERRAKLREAATQRAANPAVREQLREAGRKGAAVRWKRGESA